jgi:hypothetical protein
METFTADVRGNGLVLVRKLRNVLDEAEQLIIKKTR